MTHQLYRWQSATAALLALGICSAPTGALLTATPAAAQLFRRPPDSFARYASLPSGTPIATTYNEAKRIIVKPEESLPLKLTVTRDVLAPNGTLVIPRGSEIEGQLQPAGEGTQFVARRLFIQNGPGVNFSATSDPITRKEKVTRGPGTRTMVTGALVGGAAATIITAAIGKVGVWRSAAGAGAGALGGYLLGRRSDEVVVVDPRTDLTLTLNSDLLLN